MTADAGTHADLIAELRWHSRSRSNNHTGLTAAAADALEEAGRQLAELERGNRFRESVAEAEQERAVAAEAALKVATDALERLLARYVDLVKAEAEVMQAREALAAIRQEEKPWAQDVAAWRGYRARGWSPWPTTARACGLL